jgi:hypothetical protein
MGRLLATKLAAYSTDDRALLSAYEAALRTAGVSARICASKAARGAVAEGMGASSLGNRLGVARRFLRTWGLAGWAQLPPARQLALLITAQRHHSSLLTFVCWLGLTGRHRLHPDLLDALDRPPHPIRWLEQGRLAWPALMARLAATTRRLGYCQATADATCRAVTMATAYAATPPAALTMPELVALSDALRDRRRAWRAERGEQLAGPDHQPLNPWTTGSVLYHAGLLAEPPDTHLIGRRAGPDLEERQLGFLRDGWPTLHGVATRYVAQRRTTVRSSTIKQEVLALGRFFRWLTQHHPAVTALDQLERRTHIEPYLRWTMEEGGRGRRRGSDRWTVGTRYGHLDCLQRCFRLLALWGWPAVPPRPLFVPGDLPPCRGCRRRCRGPSTTSRRRAWCSWPVPAVTRWCASSSSCSRVVACGSARPATSRSRMWSRSGAPPITPPPRPGYACRWAS